MTLSTTTKKNMDLTASIKTIMTAEPHTAKAQDAVEVLDEIFKINRIHHVPVVDDDNEVTGIVSKSDFLYLLKGFTDNKMDTFVRAAKLRSFKVGEIMEDEVETLSESATIKQAVSILAENRFRCLPIVDDNNHLLGIVTPNDILKYIDQ